MKPEEAQAYAESTARRLSEHFDSVQILVSVLEADGSTRMHMAGSGNWYARRGMAQMFVESDQANTMGHCLHPPSSDA